MTQTPTPSHAWRVKSHCKVFCSSNCGGGQGLPQLLVGLASGHWLGAGCWMEEVLISAPALTHRLRITKARLCIMAPFNCGC